MFIYAAILVFHFKGECKLHYCQDLISVKMEAQLWFKYIKTGENLQLFLEEKDPTLYFI